MYTKTRRRKLTESMEVKTEEREADDEEEEEKENNRQLNTSKGRQYQRQRDSSTIVNNTAAALSFSGIAVTVNDDKPAVCIARLLHEADLNDLIQVDSTNQIKYFLDERVHLINQMEFIRIQFEKQYTALKRRVDEVEIENEHLTAEHRSSSKQLVLYKHFLEAPDHPDPSIKSKDYQQLKQTIDTIVKENERLYSELHHFKTSDPVYEQVQILETSNNKLKQELGQLKDENNRLKNLVSHDEVQHLKLRLSKAMDECEQLKLRNKNVLHQSEKQVHIHSLPPSPLSPRQLSPISHHSSKSLPAPYSPTDAADLREHVQILEVKLSKRDNELQKLQSEIEKGTSSIMSSIEDLYLISSNVSSTTNLRKLQPTTDELQNELDQLHDKLDELTRENQILKNRTQEFDTIYEENEYLYAEKSQWNEGMERGRIRQLVLEQEVHSLKEREKEFNLTNDPSITSNTPQLKLKIDWLNRANNQLELEVARLGEQIDAITQKYEQAKRDLVEKNQHYKRILEAAQNAQQLPQELARIEKLNTDMETEFELERQEYEKTIAALEEQSDNREQKYSSLYDTILKLQNDYRQRELDYVHQMDDITKQRDNLHVQVTAFQNIYEQLDQENKSLKEEISSKNEINRDLKSAFTSSNNDNQTVYNQLRQLNTNLIDLQQKYDRDIAERNSQVEILRTEHKQISTKYDAELVKTQQTVIQLQNDNKQYSNQLERYRSNVGKLHVEIDEKQNYIDKVQNDLTERSTLNVSINKQLAQENKVRMVKITELEQALSQEQQRKSELQRTVQDLQTELLKSRTIAKESLEKSEEFERRFHETDKHNIHVNETSEPTLRELINLRSELATKSDLVTTLQHTIEDEKLKRQRFEMKLKRLKDEYITVRKELHHRIEENTKFQHELVECRSKNDYYSQINNQQLNSLRSSNENESTTAVQLYLKEKADNQHCQLKCRTYQQKVEQFQKNYELLKQRYKEKLQEERDIFENAKIKYLDHIKSVQRDLHETRQLLEKDAEGKINQESAYQHLIDERRQLLTSMIDKDAKVREMRRENLLLTSKIQLLEKQMENLNDRVDRTLRERNQLRRESNGLRLDSNLSIKTSARSSPVLPSSRTTTYIDSTAWNQPIYYTESFGFINGHPYETSSVS